MINLDIAELRSKLDLEGKYVDFNLLRTALPVFKVVEDLDIELSEPNKAGECRSKFPNCGKDRSFCLNANTNRFNFFAKDCNLKGEEVIDFCAKLYEVSAKEASHLLSYVYGIQPYAQEQSTADNIVIEKPTDKNPPSKSEREAAVDSTTVDAQTAPSSTAQHLIASIEHQLA